MQVVLARFKLARFAAVFPAAVVEGMLAAIGLLIIAKQLPLILGTKFEAHEFWGIVRETPSQFMHMDPKVFCLGIFCLALIFALASIKARWMKVVPPQVIAAVVGLVLGWFMGLEWRPPDSHPRRAVQARHRHAEFPGAVHQPIALVGPLHDGLDPDADRRGRVAGDDRGHRQDRPVSPQVRPEQDPQRDGHLEHVFEHGRRAHDHPRRGQEYDRNPGRRRTQWANFYNACFLIIYLLLGRNLINLMPYTALGAIVLYTGYKLCAPKVWKHVAHIGSEQLFVFATTVLVTVTTDLLWGIAAGIVAKLIVEVVMVARSRAGPSGRSRACGDDRQALAR